MASNREIVALVCKECKSQNYTTTRNKINMQQKDPTGSPKLVLKKFCKNCKKQTIHKETAKLK